MAVAGARGFPVGKIDSRCPPMTNFVPTSGVEIEIVVNIMQARLCCVKVDLCLPRIEDNIVFDERFAIRDLKAPLSCRNRIIQVLIRRKGGRRHALPDARKADVIDDIILDNPAMALVLNEDALAPPGDYTGVALMA